MVGCSINMMTAESNLNYEAAILRTSYILCDNTISIGDMCFYIFIPGSLQTNSMAVKLNRLEASYKNADIENTDDWIKALTDIRKANINFHNKKFKSSKEIVAFKKLEKDINNLYQSYIDTSVDYTTEAGISQLSKLINDPEFGYLHINHINNEEINKKTGTDIIMSDAVFFKFNEDDCNAKLPIVSSDYFDSAFYSQHYYKANEPEAADSDTGYMELIFTIPDLTACTANELKIFRKILDQPGKAFRQKINEWATLCKTATDHSQGINFFITNVKPAAQSIITVIEENQYFKSLRTIAGHTQLHILLGETPLQHLWNYYRFREIIKDNTWQKIMSVAETDPGLLRRRIPVMCVSAVLLNDINVSPLSTAEKDIPEGSILSSKKYIPID